MAMYQQEKIWNSLQTCIVLAQKKSIRRTTKRFLLDVLGTADDAEF